MAGRRIGKKVAFLVGPRADLWYFDHHVTKMYVKGVRGRVCNIHCTRVQFYYWRIFSSIHFSEGRGSFFCRMKGWSYFLDVFDPPIAYIKGPLCEPPLPVWNFR